MSTHAYLDQGLAILQARLSTPPFPAESEPRTPPIHPFVTISRECCAGASSLGRKLLPLLDNEIGQDGQSWMFLDKDLITFALTQHRLPERLAEFLPEDRISETKSLIGELLGLHPSLWELEHQVAEAILQLAHVGRVVFAGRAAHLITSSLPGGFHVRLVASLESRTKRMMALQHCGEDDAIQAIARTDAARRRHVQTHFDRDIDDPHTYDLVINTDRVALATAAHLVVQALRDRLASINPVPTAPAPWTS